MDPNATLAMFFAALQAADKAAERGDAGHNDEMSALRDAVDHARDLFEWLRNGGFAPDWSKR